MQTDLGAALAKDTAEAARSLLVWIAHLGKIDEGLPTAALLEGTQAGIVEVAACLALGLVRPAIASLRAQIDMVLAWMYFKDHPVEWGHLTATGEGSRLRAEVLKYLVAYYPQFQRRFDLLVKHRTRTQEDPYGLLSIHIHPQLLGAIPTLTSLSAMVQPRKRCEEGVRLQSEVAEYLSDIFTACYTDSWHDLPPYLTDALKTRLGQSKLKALCS